MKLLLLTCLLAVAAAVPLPEEDAEAEVDQNNESAAPPAEVAKPVVKQRSEPHVPGPDHNAETLVDERSDSGDGNFNYKIETSNSIYEERTGVPGAEGQSNMNGVFRFTLDDGTVAEFSYVADETGYKPVSNLLPTPHPLPAHVHELLRIAEEQRAQGITFDTVPGPTVRRAEIPAEQPAARREEIEEEDDTEETNPDSES